MHIVLLVHGIRTSASWAEMVQEELQRDTSLIVIPIRYGFFDLLEFLLPGPTRTRPINRVLRELRTLRSEHPSSRISVIAHSFGTYAITQILRSHPDVTLFRLALCGGIVPASFRWDLVRPRVSESPINDCGLRDIWPLLASAVTWGYGPSGVAGFGSVLVVDRFHELAHSGFFKPAFASTYWKPYFTDGVVVRPQQTLHRRALPYWRQILPRLPVQWLLLLALALLPIGSLKGWFKPSKNIRFPSGLVCVAPPSDILADTEISAYTDTLASLIRSGAPVDQWPERYRPYDEALSTIRILEFRLCLALGSEHITRRTYDSLMIQLRTRLIAKDSGSGR
jgi:pimeloyl-ACP methyl ester carboxylesterase